MGMGVAVLRRSSDGGEKLIPGPIPYQSTPVYLGVRGGGRFFELVGCSLWPWGMGMSWLPDILSNSKTEEPEGGPWSLLLY